MTDKEFKKLSRSQLIDIILQLQLKQDELIDENTELKNALSDKSLRMEKVGNIAEAALELNNIFNTAQKAADQYLEEIRLMKEEIEKELRKISNENK